MSILRPVVRSHMPFVTRLAGRRMMFFAAMTTDKVWKLHYTDLDNWKPALLDLKSGSTTVECAPSVYEEEGNGMINLTAVVGYRLLHMRARTIEELPLHQSQVVDERCTAGYMSPTYLVWTAGTRVYVNNRATGERFSFVPRPPGLPRVMITRLAFLPEDETLVLITGTCFETPFTLLVDLDNGRCWEVRASNGPIYKCALFEGELIYAVRTGDDFEARTLVATRDFTMTELERITYENAAS